MKLSARQRAQSGSRVCCEDGKAGPGSIDDTLHTDSEKGLDGANRNFAFNRTPRLGLFNDGEKVTKSMAGISNNGKQLFKVVYKPECFNVTKQKGKKMRRKTKR